MNNGFKLSDQPGIMDVVARKKPKIGGPRPGAGRKRVLKDPELRSVSFEAAQVRALKAIARRRGWTRSRRPSDAL